ncbi:50S ribosomal protein L5 [Candidatus Uhrbacteria bacterium]|nr:50S ribosomal protein L5 [Candidatus Uhrbacteria bacterium]
MADFRSQFTKEIAPRLAGSLGIENLHAIPRLVKVVINVGYSPARDPKVAEVAEAVLARITGQKPVKTIAKKSISNFKIRQGMPIGAMVTLRGRRMYDFVARLVHIALPRVRDFRGLPSSSIDARGNLSIGFREYIAFPEIRLDEVDKLHGLEVTLVTNARSEQRGRALFEALGFPLRKS